VFVLLLVEAVSDLLIGVDYFLFHDLDVSAEPTQQELFQFFLKAAHFLQQAFYGVFCGKYLLFCEGVCAQ
jgi:hypothetical protein